MTMSFGIDISKNAKTISKIILLLKKTILPILLTLFLFWLYVKCFCFFSDKSSYADLVCSLNWRDGLFLVSSYSIVKLVSPLLLFDTVLKRVLITFFLYCFSLGLMAFPFLVVSFLQPLGDNVFIHTLLLILTIEFVFADNQKHAQ